MRDLLRPHCLQHSRLACPSLSPRVCSNSCLLSWCCHPTISSSDLLSESEYQRESRSHQAAVAELGKATMVSWTVVVVVERSGDLCGIVSSPAERCIRADVRLPRKIIWELQGYVCVFSLSTNLMVATFIEKGGLEEAAVGFRVRIWTW